jgi:hypothetical protein
MQIYQNNTQNNSDIKGDGNIVVQGVVENLSIQTKNQSKPICSAERSKTTRLPAKISLVTIVALLANLATIAEFYFREQKLFHFTGSDAAFYLQFWIFMISLMLFGLGFLLWRFKFIWFSWFQFGLEIGAGGNIHVIWLKGKCNKCGSQAYVTGYSMNDLKVICKKNFAHQSECDPTELEKLV